MAGKREKPQEIIYKNMGNRLSGPSTRNINPWFWIRDKLTMRQGPSPHRESGASSRGDGKTHQIKNLEP